MTTVLLEDEDSRLSYLATYLVRSRNSHTVWAAQMFLCELLSLLNVILNIVLLDAFLGGEFSSYGLEVLKHVEKEPNQRTDPMSRVFPKITKCLFQNHGPSGSIQTFDALCILPITPACFPARGTSDASTRFSGSFHTQTSEKGIAQAAK